MGKWRRGKEKSSILKTWDKIKKERKMEKYLENKDIVGRSILGRLRAGANFLRIDKGREKGEDRDERICRTCLKEIEDEEHFILRCDGYTDIRNEYKEKIEIIMKQEKNEYNDEETNKYGNQWLKIFLGQIDNENVIKLVIESQKRIT